MGISHNKFLYYKEQMPINTLLVFAIRKENCKAADRFTIIFISTSNCTVAWTFDNKLERDKVYNRVLKYQLNSKDLEKLLD